jgi:hypothetical protein
VTAVATLAARPRCRNPKCGKARRKLPNGRTEGSRDLCWACHSRWLRAGCPEVIPDAMTHAERTALATEVAREAMRSRLEDYELLLSARVDRQEAARRVGVTVKWTYVYDAMLRRGERASHAA